MQALSIKNDSFTAFQRVTDLRLATIDREAPLPDPLLDLTA
jgi:hypothetical protein